MGCGPSSGVGHTAHLPFSTGCIGWRAATKSTVEALAACVPTRRPREISGRCAPPRRRRGRSENGDRRSRTALLVVRPRSRSRSDRVGKPLFDPARRRYVAIGALGGGADPPSPSRDRKDAEGQSPAIARQDVASRRRSNRSATTGYPPSAPVQPEHSCGPRGPSGASGGTPAGALGRPEHAQHALPCASRNRSRVFERKVLDLEHGLAYQRPQLGPASESTRMSRLSRPAARVRRRRRATSRQ